MSNGHPEALLEVNPVDRVRPQRLAAACAGVRSPGLPIVLCGAAQHHWPLCEVKGDR